MIARAKLQQTAVALSGCQELILMLCPIHEKATNKKIGHYWSFIAV